MATYVLSHPDGVDCLPKGKLERELFTLALTAGAFGRWEITRKDGVVLKAYLTQPLQTIDYTHSRESAQIFQEIIRGVSQTDRYFFDIAEMRMYICNSGNTPADFIVTRHSLCNTELAILMCANPLQYQRFGILDMDRPEPNFS
jgi:hypothetical protein